MGLEELVLFVPQLGMYLLLQIGSFAELALGLG